MHAVEDVVVSLPDIKPAASGESAYAQKSSAISPVDFASIPGLSPEARRIFGAMPDGICPTETALYYPRILNRIAEVWTRPAALEEYMDSLILSDRPNRQGFPVRVGMELFKLAGYVKDGQKDRS